MAAPHPKLKELTQERVRETFDYDPMTGRLIRKVKSAGGRVGKPVGSIEPSGHRRCECFGARVTTAHLVWLWHNGAAAHGFLTHINGDKSDDRIENLRILKQKLMVSYEHDESRVTEYGRLPAGVTSGIYEIRCTVTGRAYVGSAVNLGKRWQLHYTQLQNNKHHSRHLQRAWNKYGESCFVFHVVELCEKADLLVREQSAIDSLKPAFNSRPLAHSNLGMVMSEQARRNMSASRPRDFSPMAGKQHSEEAKAKMSASKKGVKKGPYSEERKAKTAASMREARNALTEREVRRIRFLKSIGLPHRDVANIVCRSYWAVADVVRNRTYSWVI